MDFGEIISGLSFRFAKTMPHMPHEYVVKTAQHEENYSNLFRLIKRDGVFEFFGGRKYQYLYPGDGWKYWIMAEELADSHVINRAKVV